MNAGGALHDIQMLKSSLAFNMSLSSKELFHSNLLAFLFKIYPDLFFNTVESSGGPAAINRSSKIDIKREYKHIDIFVVHDNHKYVIENKVKDIAGKDQLERILKNNDGDSYYLFSLLPVLDNDMQPWKIIGYEEIVKQLRAYTEYDEYTKFLVNDYCSFMEILIHHVKSKCSLENYWFYRSNPLIIPWAEIRMHDVFLKYGMGCFKRHFANSNNGIEEDYRINNAKPTMTFAKKHNGITYSIQVEDLEYRRGVLCAEKDLEAFEKLKWFDCNYRTKRKLRYRSYSAHNGMKYYYQVQNDIDLRKCSFDDLSTRIKRDMNNLVNA